MQQYSSKYFARIHQFPRPLGGLGGGTEAKAQPFQFMIMLHIKLKAMMHGAIW